ncbi:acyltransferase family protein [Streptomyces sp. L500]|uniref:acyltransferase family protein n=1 Tax=Streptomyces abikoensis TaxID=97398 RepID=UPI00367D1B82
MRFASGGGNDGVRPGGPAPRLCILDGLRLLAALMVVLYHYTSLNGGWNRDPRLLFPGIEPITRYGWLGVEIFFLISGFVICMSAWGRPLGDFVVSRAARIYPAYWVAILLTGGVVLLWPQVRSVAGPEQVFTNLTMLQQGLGVWDVDGVYWTLFVELKFYVLFALVVARGVTYRRCVIFCGVWTLAAAIAPTADSKLLTLWATPFAAPYFVAGIAYYLMHRYRPTALLWGIVVISYLLANHQVAKRVHDNANHPTALFPAQAMVFVIFAVMALVALGTFDRVRWRWLTTAGALTYPMYLLHQYIGMTIIYALREAVPPLPLVAGLITVMLGAAWLLHRYVERPLGRRLRSALRKSMEDVRHSATAPALDGLPLLNEPRRSDRVGAVRSEGG